MQYRSLKKQWIFNRGDKKSVEKEEVTDALYTF